MKKEELNMDKKFREKMEGFSAEPPSHVWNNIQDQLAILQRKRRLAYIRWIAAAAVIILAFIAGWYFNEKSGGVIPNAAENQASPAQQTTPQHKNNVAQQSQANTQEDTMEAGKAKLTATNATKTKEQEILKIKTEDRAPKKVLQENTGTGTTFLEKFSMQKIGSKIASIQEEKPQLSLQKEETIAADQLTESEKALMAENAKRFAKPSKEQQNWKMGLSVSPGYASHVTSHSGNYAQNMTYSNSEGNGNISGGFSVQYKTGKKWSVESGIYYAKDGQRSSNSPPTEKFYSFAPALVMAEKSYFNTAVNMVDGRLAMNSAAGVIQFSRTPRGTEMATNLDNSYDGATTLLTSGEFSQVFNFIEIPLYLRYNVIDSKIGVEVLGGLNAGIVAGNNVYMENRFGTENVGKTQDISTLNVSGTVGFGLNYSLSRRISLSVEPRLSYYLNSINKNPDVMFRPYRIGVYTGLYYQF